jgi:hypothetical protein
MNSQETPLNTGSAVVLAAETAPTRGVVEIVEEINRKLQSETVEFIMQIGRDLVELFGSGTGPNRVRGLLLLSKARYPTVGLRLQYSWTRQLIKIATSPNLADRATWPLLPPVRSALYECSLMTPARFAEGIRPNSTGETIIHPRALKKKLQIHRRRSEPIRQPRRPPAQTVILIYLPAGAGGDEYDLAGNIDRFRDHAFDAGAGFGIGEQVGRSRVLQMDTDPDVPVIAVTINQHGNTERHRDPPRNNPSNASKMRLAA